MDDKTSRRDKSGVYERRRKQVISSGRKVWQMLRTHRTVLVTCILLCAFVVLLFAVLSQLPGTTTNAAPAGVTSVNYSTFVGQVNNGNVLAAVIQGNNVNGFLAEPLSQGHNTTTATTVHKLTLASTDYTVWSHSLGMSSAPMSATSTALPIDTSHALFTQLPPGSSAVLMNVLLNNHVLVHTLPVASTPLWLVWLERLAPFLLVAVIMLVFLLTRNRQSQDGSIDQRVSHLGKSRVRRFERSKETNALSTPPQKTSSGPTNKLGASGKSSAARVSTAPPITFDDVAGIDEVRSELVEIVQFLRSPERFNRLGARIPRGALLVGPPGTGKTLLARAVAGEAHVPFFSMSASEFVEMFVGVGASRVRDLFSQARKAAPCVIFIDELDAVGRKRSTRMSSNDERDQTLNQLLVELDGFDTRQAVVVLAATNRVDILDKALLRPGRFDRRIMVSPPDRVGREAILQVHTRKTPLHEDVELERLARLTTGMTGADLANLVNEAALVAARRDLERVDHACFEDALARVQLGALRPLVMSEEERRTIAVHEGGHALVAYHLDEADTVNRVTILPRGQSLGVTQFTAEDRYNYSRSTLMARIAVGLGGRVAEELTFGVDRITTGAENDLQVVTDLARRMVTRWGMSEQVGVVFADYQAGSDDYALNMRRGDTGVLPQARALAADANGRVLWPRADALGQAYMAMSAPMPRNSNGVAMNTLIDTEVQRILNEGRDMARQLLTIHKDQLQLLADMLIVHEQLDRGQFEELLRA